MLHRQQWWRAAEDDVYAGERRLSLTSADQYLQSAIADADATAHIDMDGTRGVLAESG
jgi:hypothetical protein